MAGRKQKHTVRHQRTYPYPFGLKPHHCTLSFRIGVGKSDIRRIHKSCGVHVIYGFSDAVPVGSQGCLVRIAIGVISICTL